MVHVAVAVVEGWAESSVVLVVCEEGRRHVDALGGGNFGPGKLS